MVNLNRANFAANQPMGAVRVKVKLTNAIDEALVSRGMLNPNMLRVYETEALVDTGAVPGRPHHVNKQSLFSIELKLMSLTLAYCENFRRSLWCLKNNQARNPDFFVGF